MTAETSRVFGTTTKRPVIGLGCTPEAFLQQKGQHPFQLSVELHDDEPRLSQRPHPPFQRTQAPPRSAAVPSTAGQAISLVRHDLAEEVSQKSQDPLWVRFKKIKNVPKNFDIYVQKKKHPCSECFTASISGMLNQSRACCSQTQILSPLSSNLPL